MVFLDMRIRLICCSRSVETTDKGWRQFSKVGRWSNVLLVQLSMKDCSSRFFTICGTEDRLLVFWRCFEVSSSWQNPKFSQSWITKILFRTQKRIMILVGDHINHLPRNYSIVKTWILRQNTLCAVFRTIFFQIYCILYMKKPYWTSVQLTVLTFSSIVKSVLFICRWICLFGVTR